MPKVIRNLADAQALVGEELGLSEWIVVDQNRINQFADATDDHQWIHVDPERAAKEFPLGTTCAHGYLTISLIPALIEGMVEFPTIERLINYGINKARFRTMVPSGSRVRMRASLKSAKKRAGALQCVLDCDIEMEGQVKPVASAEIIVMYFLTDL
ncbi:MAG: MaoC family dehydratase [Gammaproteobacteria bacterium]|nr:MaoC family dehydratase [Gammaproteobacteria bacterium]NND55592.1 MaoC family dehydratase [Gammaproteobacteria bacterium]